MKFLSLLLPHLSGSWVLLNVILKLLKICFFYQYYYYFVSIDLNILFLRLELTFIQNTVVIRWNKSLLSEICNGSRGRDSCQKVDFLLPIVLAHSVLKQDGMMMNQRSVFTYFHGSNPDPRFKCLDLDPLKVKPISRSVLMNYLHCADYWCACTDTLIWWS